MKMSASASCGILTSRRRSSPARGTAVSRYTVGLELLMLQDPCLVYDCPLALYNPPYVCRVHWLVNAVKEMGEPCLDRCCMLQASVVVSGLVYIGGCRPRNVVSRGPLFAHRHRLLHPQIEVAYDRNSGGRPTGDCSRGKCRGHAVAVNIRCCYIG